MLTFLKGPPELGQDEADVLQVMALQAQALQAIHDAAPHGGNVLFQLFPVLFLVPDRGPFFLGLLQAFCLLA